MRLRKLLILVLLAASVSLVICQLWIPVSYEEQLIRIQAKQEIGYIDENVVKEPLEVQAMLLDYSKDKVLVLKAWISLSKYPEKAREILLLYGSEPEFKEILINYGESIIPPIQYFQENDIWTVRATNLIGEGMKSTTEYAKNLWDRISGKGTSNSDSVGQTQPSEGKAQATVFGPKERGWYAVNFIKQEGHDFLGQFVVDKDGKVKWLQTERILEGTTSFLTSGLRTIETKYDLGEDITKGDVFWAAVDIAVVAGSIKALRIGKTVAASGKKLSFVSRTRLFASKLLSKTKIFQTMGTIGAVVATAYILVSHPSLINSALTLAANLMGWSPWLVQFIGWSLIIAIALYPFSWLLKILARMVLLVLSWLEKSLPRAVPKTAPVSASVAMSGTGDSKNFFNKMEGSISVRKSEQQQHSGAIIQTRSQVKEITREPSGDSQGTKWFEKALNLHKANKYAEAIEAYSRALGINPSYAIAHYNRAVIYNRLRKTQDAFEDLKAAARLGHSKSRSFLESKGMTW